MIRLRFAQSNVKSERSVFTFKYGAELFYFKKIRTELLRSDGS
jgi:hypothetical protein